MDRKPGELEERAPTYCLVCLYPGCGIVFATGHELDMHWKAQCAETLASEGNQTTDDTQQSAVASKISTIPAEPVTEDTLPHLFPVPTLSTRLMSTREYTIMETRDQPPGDSLHCD